MRSPINIQRAVAERLQIYRLRHGLTLQSIADRAGVTVSTVWRIETGAVRPTALTAYKLMRALPGMLKGGRT